jgi:hypothetical protein
MNLNKDDTALVLAGLRLLQVEMKLQRAMNLPQLTETDFQICDLEYIDNLCARINCAKIRQKANRKKAAKREVITNKEQQLYVIPEGTGYNCLGFDVCLERIKGYAADLGLDVDQAQMERGSMSAYQYYQSLIAALYERHKRTGQRCNVELTPQLIGLEGKRVEVTDRNGETRSFWVGKSTGWIPIHLEVARRNSTGGGGVTGAPFKSVRVLEDHR